MRNDKDRASTEGPSRLKDPLSLKCALLLAPATVRLSGQPRRHAGAQGSLFFTVRPGKRMARYSCALEVSLVPSWSDVEESWWGSDTVAVSRKAKLRRQEGLTSTALHLQHLAVQWCLRVKSQSSAGGWRLA